MEFLHAYLWPLMALGFSFCGALIVGFNHWANIDGTRLVVLRTLGVLPLVGIAALVLPWPHELAFYGVAGGMGVLLAFADKILFTASAKYGGRLAALYIPMKMLLGFVLWGMFVPSSVAGLVMEPWRGLVVVAGFGLCTAALFSLRRQDASWVALMAVVPVAVLLAIGDVVAKYALDTTADGLVAVLGSATAFLFITTSVGSVVGLCVSGTALKDFRPTRREVGLSAVFGVILLLSLSLFLTTLAIAPNPGYVGAITMLSALWLAVHGYFRHGERTNWWGGVCLLGGAVLVALGAA